MNTQSATKTKNWIMIPGTRDCTDSFLQELESRLHYCSCDIEDFRLCEEDGGIEFIPKEIARTAEITELLAELTECMLSGHVEREKRISFDRRELPLQIHENVIESLEASGEIKMLGAGRVSLSGRPAQLLERLDELFVGIADQLGAQKHHYPNLISTDVLHRCDYFGSFPQYLTFATHLREDLGSLRSFVKGMRDKESMETNGFDQMATPEHVLSPTVCFHCYEHMLDKELPEDGGPPITARNNCYRYEAENLKSLERLWDFSMREIVFFGPPERVRSQLQECNELTRKLVDELSLHCWIESAFDSFFVDDFAKKSSFQTTFDLKQELRLTHATGSVAAASFNFHNDFFTKAYGIEMQEQPKVVSACVGFGLERFVFAVLSQKGLDPSNWPSILQPKQGDKNNE